MNKKTKFLGEIMMNSVLKVPKTTASLGKILRMTRYTNLVLGATLRMARDSNFSDTKTMMLKIHLTRQEKEISTTINLNTRPIVRAESKSRHLKKTTVFMRAQSPGVRAT
jgi:hypothetical protein